MTEPENLIAVEALTSHYLDLADHHRSEIVDIDMLRRSRKEFGLKAPHVDLNWQIRIYDPQAQLTSSLDCRSGRGTSGRQKRVRPQGHLRLEDAHALSSGAVLLRNHRIAGRIRNASRSVARRPTNAGRVNNAVAVHFVAPFAGLTVVVKSLNTRAARPEASCAASACASPSTICATSLGLRTQGSIRSGAAIAKAAHEAVGDASRSADLSQQQGAGIRRDPGRALPVGLAHPRVWL